MGVRLEEGIDSRLDGDNGTANGELLAESPVVAHHVVAELAGSMPRTVACGTGHTASTAANDGLPNGEILPFPEVPPFPFGAAHVEDVEGVSSPDGVITPSDMVGVDASSSVGADGLRRLCDWFTWAGKIRDILRCGSRVWRCSSAFSGVGCAKLSAQSLGHWFGCF